MLKFTYTETSLCLEYLTQPTEELITQRVVLALRAGQSFVVERSTASFLLPASLPGLHLLETMVQQEQLGAIALYPCDVEYIEVSLKGTWISSQADGTEGIFVVEIGHPIEFSIFKLWQKSQTCGSFLRR